MAREERDNASVRCLQGNEKERKKTGKQIS